MCSHNFGFRTLAGLFAAAIAMLSVLVLAGLAPEPDPVPRRWQLSVEPGPLRMASVESNGQIQSYYFLTYKVTNTSDTDLLFTPMFDLVTENNEIVRSGRGVTTEVTRDILARLDNPYIQDQISIVGVLLQGEANAKEGLVVWAAPALHASELKVFGAGFSGETRGVPVREADGSTRNIMLRKTLMLTYKPQGDLRNMGSAVIPMVDKRWVMR